jgi:hypothetical protein
MMNCTLCKCAAQPASPGTFVLEKVLYHEACLPNCENCGKEVSHYNCYRIWDSDPPNGDWKARHKRC